ncbi:insulin-like growth factor-binding protein 1 [Eublepharis macularius]|uniref:Insulin-like growth factor-binding protein 1 n=1 Tax=Eublepharis macularius TaxID=481883 RepID=A0AA97JZ92_EUBMA|nr:insulin-like growth factor-binding protein 1 [Eublepharis macularius]
MRSPGLRCEVLLFLLCPSFLLGATLHAIHCAPCTEEKLALCPPVPASCPETARQPGCGCCHTCALQEGEPCGVYTAQCGQGLHCRVHPGEPKPLFALTRGQGTCLSTADTTEATDSVEPEDVPTEGAEMTADQLFNYQLMFPIGQDKSVPWNAISAYESMKAKRLTEFRRGKQQGPCQKELYRALDRLAKAQQRTGGEIYRFYLPNCNKNGFYHTKQCETSLDGTPAGCWCVYPKNGRRIPGSPETAGDPDCEQYLNSQE